MVIFNSYVELPEGNIYFHHFLSQSSGWLILKMTDIDHKLPSGNQTLCGTFEDTAQGNHQLQIVL